MMSVITKTMGQSNTPAENCKAPCWPKRLKLKRSQPERILEGEDFHADKLGDQRVGDKEAAQEDEEPAGTVGDDI
jgi:hypothetical protein